MTALKVTIGAAGTVFFGSFLPWVAVAVPNAGTLDQSGGEFDYVRAILLVYQSGMDGDGVFTAIASSILLIIAFVAHAKKTLGSGMSIFMVLLSCGIALISVDDFLQFQIFAGDGLGIEISAGIGLYLVQIGAVVAITASIIAMRARDKN